MREKPTESLSEEVLALRSIVLANLSKEEKKVSLDLNSLENIQKEFRKLQSGIHLKEATLELLRFSYFLHKQKDTLGEEALFELAKSSLLLLQNQNNHTVLDNELGKYAQLLGQNKEVFADHKEPKAGKTLIQLLTGGFDDK